MNTVIVFAGTTEGRKLSDIEESLIVDAINASCDVDVACIVGKNENDQEHTRMIWICACFFHVLCGNMIYRRDSGEGHGYRCIPDFWHLSRSPDMQNLFLLQGCA